jgi:hypothetical protein
MPYVNIQGIPTTPQPISRQVRKTTVNYQVAFQTVAVAQNQNPGQYGDAMSLLQYKVTWSHKGPMDLTPRNYSCVLQTIVRQTK